VHCTDTRPGDERDMQEPTRGGPDVSSARGGNGHAGTHPKRADPLRA